MQISPHFRQLLLFVALWTALPAIGSPRAIADEAKSPPKGQRIFYTGHSFHMFVPRHVEAIVEAAGIKGHKLVGRQGIGGSRVYQHWDLPDERNRAKQALKTGKIDVFTMAAHVTMPDRGISSFTAFGLKHNPKLRLLVQASWYPFDVPGAKRVRRNEQRDRMVIKDLQAAIDAWRKKLEAQVDSLNKKNGRKAVFIVPVGDAVVKLRAMVVAGKFPGVKRQSELFRDRIGHGLAHVQALASYCNFAAIYGVSPQRLKVRFRGVSEAQHAILQKLAWETVSGYSHAGIAKTSSQR